MQTFLVVFVKAFLTEKERGDDRVSEKMGRAMMVFPGLPVSREFNYPGSLNTSNENTLQVRRTNQSEQENN